MILIFTIKPIVHTSLTFVLIWLDRIYGYTPRDHELLPTSTQLLRQQAAAAAESSNSADSGEALFTRNVFYPVFVGGIFDLFHICNVMCKQHQRNAFNPL